VRARKLLLRAVVGALCTTAAIAVVVLLSGSFDDTSWRILASTSAVSFFGLLAAPAGVLLERDHAVLLARTSAALTGASFVLTLVVIWSSWSDDLGKAWGILLTLAAAAAQAAAVESRRRDTDGTTIRRLVAASMLTGSLLAAMGVLAILTEIDDGGYYRLLGAVAVVDLLLIVLVAVLRRGSGPIGQTHRVRVDGRLVEVPGRDWAAAVATAIRQAEHDGSTVRRIERT
jgi:peptidoglycan/LPS O-acetylase OafA/YrhL